MIKSKVTSDLSGLSKLADNLENLSKGLEEEPVVSLTDILTPEFISQHTKFKNLEDLFQASGFECNTQEEFEALPEEELSRYIQSISFFDTFQEMLQTAGTEYFKERIFKGLK